MKNNIFKRVLCAVLCLCMLTGTLLALVSCNEEETPEATEGVVNVVKIVKDIPAGTVITGDMITTEEIKVSNVHINAIRALSRVKGKVALQDMYAGEFVFAAKLGEPATEELDEFKANLVVTDHIELTDDVTDALQELIDNNPGRTLEFPDGEYIISKPITVPADTAKAVSFRLSDYAVIRATDDWESDEAMIKFAVGEIPAESPIKNFYINGGTIDGNHVAKTLYVENAKEVLIANVGLANTLVGLEIAGGTADVENINISGTEADDCVGMIISGTDCTATNVRINTVVEGVKVIGKNNVLKSVYAVCADSSKSACGFYDMGAGSVYDMCISEQFSNAFKMSADSVAIYSACVAKWNDGLSKQHWAFVAEKKFNSVIRTCKVEFDFENCNGSFLVVGDTGGSGQVIYPIIGGKENMKGNTFRNYLVNYIEEEDPVIYMPKQ